MAAVGEDSWEDRLETLKQEVHAAFGPPAPSSQALNFTIARDDLLGSALSQLRKQPIEHWRRRWCIRFLGEPSSDDGGLIAEFFTLLPTTMCHPSTGFFLPFDCPQVCSQDDIHTRSRLHPNPSSQRAIADFRFAGKICAKSLLDSLLFGFKTHMPVRFTTAFYKKLLNQPTHWSDFETDDQGLFEGKIRFLQSTTITQQLAEELDLTWTYSARDVTTGQITTVELQPGGASIFVTDETKQAYLDALCRHRFDSSVAAQFKAFYSGFRKVLGGRISTVLSIFDHRELELLLFGTTKFDLADWQENIRYFQCTSESRVVQWFWRAIEAMSHEERGRLIQFITGSSQLPIGGFCHFSPKIGIQMHSPPEKLPWANTCFNVINLTPAATFSVFKKRLMCAVNEGCVGFSLK